MRLIVLDRDGVINEDADQHIRHADAWHPILGSIEAMADLYHAGYTLVVMTNQSGIARGYFSVAELDAMHDKLKTVLARHKAVIAGIYYCPHHPDEGCACRKPRPGMLRQIAADFPTADLREAIVIGDSWRDLCAGKAMHCRTILVQTGKGRLTYAHHREALADTLVVADLAEAARQILSE